MPWSVSTDFIDTASLTSALVYGGMPGTLGSLNTSALIGSTSGLGYGPNGIVPSVPEPGTLFLLSTGLALIGAMKLRRGRRWWDSNFRD